jgi:hypothetical protein
LIEIIHHRRVKFHSIIVKILKTNIPFSEDPVIVSVKNRNFILETKNKSKGGRHIILIVVNFATHKMYKNCKSYINYCIPTIEHFYFSK